MPFFSPILPEKLLPDALSFIDQIGDLSLPVDTPAPTFQETLSVRSEVLQIEPTIGVPVPNSNPVLVTEAALPSGTDNDIPAPPPVFFPTQIGPGFIKSVGDDFGGAEVPAPALTVQASAIGGDVSGRFSNVDLGLATLAGVSILATGAVALLRRG